MMRANACVAAGVLFATMLSAGAGAQEAASFANYPAPEYFYFAHGPNETAIGVNERTGNVLFQMAADTARVRWDDSVSPPSATWEDVSFHTLYFGLDPMLYTDRTSGRTFVLQLLGPVSSASYTDDDGDNWSVGVPPSSAPSSDHETIGSGPYAEPAPLTASWSHAFYYCAHGGSPSQCARSDDGGVTWGPPMPVQIRSCGGLHGHVVVGDDGTVYVPHRNCPPAQAVLASRDNGVTWTQHQVPGTEPTNNDPDVALDRGGRLYFATTDRGKAVVATSIDRAATFSDPVDLSSQVGVRNVAFPSVVAGDAGRAAMAFYGTTTPGDAEDPAFTGEWHVYVGITLDGGQTWTTVDVTPDDPVQRGLMCLRGVSCRTGRNLLDFQSLTVDTEGRVIVGYADGCTTTKCIEAEGKSNADSGSNDSLGTIARQISGPRLFAAFG
jgi:hypothetical protein